MKYSYCLICHRAAVDGLVLSFNCDPSGAIEGLCTTPEDRPITICKGCHVELLNMTATNSRLVDNTTNVPGEYYWTFGFPGLEREAKSIKMLDKEHVKFLLTTLTNPPEELVIWANQKNDIIDENRAID